MTLLNNVPHYRNASCLIRKTKYHIVRTKYILEIFLEGITYNIHNMHLSTFIYCTASISIPTNTS
jgi:hypothetical protein